MSRRQLWHAVLLSGAIGSLTGCHCCSAYGPYAATIDWISDIEACNDHLYHPRFDLSRRTCCPRHGACQCHASGPMMTGPAMAAPHHGVIHEEVIHEDLLDHGAPPAELPPAPAAQAPVGMFRTR